LDTLKIEKTTKLLSSFIKSLVFWKDEQARKPLNTTTRWLAAEGMSSYALGQLFNGCFCLREIAVRLVVASKIGSYKLAWLWLAPSKASFYLLAS
jgi:hypothetical protein